MNNLSASVLDDIERASYEIAKQAKEHYLAWKAGEIYYSIPALRAMGRRYLYLRDTENLRPLEVYEYGRLFAFFCQVYPPDGEVPSVAAIAIDFCNLVNTPSPTE